MICEGLQNSAVRLRDSYERKITGLKFKFLKYAEQELIRRKELKNQLYFDDLLLNVHRALHSDSQRDNLIRALQRKYRSALIDEFQDTDLIQYEIFSTIFKKNSPLFLIGDPKQSIYSFRGADIFTYLNASEMAENRYTLLKNYRSSPELLSAINSFFGSSDNAFVFNEIQFNESTPGIDSDTQSIVIDGVNQPNFNLLFIDNETETLNKSRLTDLIVHAVVSKIASLLWLGSEKRAYIGSEPITASQIAILVRTNREAELVQQKLSALKVSSVTDSGSSVFASIEAQDLQRVLAAITEPHRADLIRAALTTSIFNHNGNQIENFSKNQKAFELLLIRFVEYHDMWLEHGFEFMIRALFVHEHVRRTALSLSRGERRLTNLIHLSELLHLEQQRQRADMFQLLAWFREKINNNSVHVPDEEMLRLESDYEAVKIITVHKSKGLEFPIVFCPFCWHSSEISRRNEPFIFHSQDLNYSPQLALGPEEISVYADCAEKEILAENMRLLYVALTRAKSSCYLYWGKIRAGDSSALAYLLFGSDMPDPLAGSLKDKLKSLSSKELMNRLQELHETNPLISVENSDDSDTEEIEWHNLNKQELKCREFSGAIAEQWHISSFSSLTRNRTMAEMPDYDSVIEHKTETPPKPIGDVDLTSIYSFPKGARAGTFMHDILERINFQNSESPQTDEIIKERLQFYGFDEKWQNAIQETISNVVNTSLDKKSDFQLSKLPLDSCLKEVEFYFPLKKITSLDLRQVFSTDMQTDLFQADYSARGLEFSPTRGYMKGYIDLIFKWGEKFFLIDWKSNHLGANESNYSENALNEEMKKEHYTLQYHIYLTALNRFLQYRFPSYSYKKNFGGVYYLFLRGMSTGSSLGIYYDLPSSRCIEQLTSVLIK